MTDSLRGTLAMIAACSIWGVSGVYFTSVSHVPPLEIMAHRVIWSMVFFVGLFAVQGRLGSFVALLRDRRAMGLLVLTGLLISVNWVGYIWAVVNGLAQQASLGYYIFPLMAVSLGFVVFGERFSRLQQAAFVLAAVAVVVLTVRLGAVPWIALLLATTFSTYGLLKKRTSLGPVLSVGGEVAVLVPIAAGYLVYLGLTGSAGASTAADWGWMTITALFTGGPLVLFSYASRRLPYATVGLIQYLNPTLQFAVAVLYLSEPFGAAQALAFPLIWLAVGLYCLDLWRQGRQSRRLVRS